MVQVQASRRSATRWLGLAALTLSGLVVALDNTVLVTALPTLSQKLGASTSELQWITTAYSLALAGLLLPAGVLADRYGRRLLMLIGLLFFGVASLVASTATSASELIWVRAAMGIGGAIILPLALAVLPSVFEPEEQPRAVAIASAGAFLGLPLGPLMAGWLLVHYAWGSIFLINVPVVALALIAVWFWIPESRDPVRRKLDWPGALLAVAGVTSVVYGIIQEPLNGWSNPQVVAAVAAGVVLLAVFVAWELRTRDPLVDLTVVRDGGFAWPAGVFMVISFAMVGVLFVLTPFLQIVLGGDAQKTGLELLPMIAALIVGALPSDVAARRLGVRALVVGGLLIAAAGTVLMIRANASTGYGPAALALAVIGFGMGISMPPAVNALLSSLPAERTGMGTGLQRAAQQVGVSFGVAVLGSVLNSGYRSALAPHLAGLPGSAAQVAESSVAGAFAVAARLPGPVGEALRAAARSAYSTGMTHVLLACAAIAVVLALTAGLFMPAPSPASQEGREGTTID